MKYLLAVMLFTVAGISWGQDTSRYRPLSILAPTYMAVEAYETEHLHDPYLDPIDAEMKYGGNFLLDFNFVEYGYNNIYSKNLLHFDQSEESGQIKHAGWNYQLGATVWGNGTQAIAIERQHHSRHILEDTRPMHFPVYDRNVLKFVLFDRGF